MKYKFEFLKENIDKFLKNTVLNNSPFPEREMGDLLRAI